MPASEFSDVFISYRRKDVEFVKQLVTKLNQAGKEVWVDWEDIPPGSVGFTDEIRRGLDGTDALICVLSPDYLESPYCVDMELKYALSVNKRVVPIVYRKFEGYEIPAGIGHINWIYFTPHAGQENTLEEGFPKVMEALDSDFDHMRAHKRLLVRALDWDKNVHKRDYLLKGEELLQSEQWLANVAGKDPQPTDLHKQFIIVSREHMLKNMRRQMTLLGGGLVVALVLAVLAIIGFWQSTVNAQRASEAEAIAVRRSELSDARLLASRLPDAAIGNPFLGYALSMSILEMEDPPMMARWQAQQTLLNFGAVRSLPLTQPSESTTVAGIWLADNTLLNSYCMPPNDLWRCTTSAITRRNMETGAVLNTVTYEGTPVMLFSDDGALGVMISCEVMADGCGHPIFTVLDTATGETLRTINGSHRIIYSGVITGILSGSDIAWDILYALPGHQMLVHSCVDFNVELYQCQQYTVERYDLDSGELLMDYRDVLPSLLDVTVFDGGTKVASRTSEHEVLVWDVESGAVLQQVTMEGTVSGIFGGAQNERAVVATDSYADFERNTSDESSYISVEYLFWESYETFATAYLVMDNGDVIQGYRCAGRGCPLNSLNIYNLDSHWAVADFATGSLLWFGASPDQSLIVTFGDDGVRLWDTSLGRHLFAPLTGDVAFIPGTHTLVDSYGGIWDIDTGDYRTLVGEAQTFPFGVLPMPDGESVIALIGELVDSENYTYSYTLERYNLATGERLQSAPFNIDAFIFDPQSVSPDGSSFLSCTSIPASCQLYDSETLEPTHDLNLEGNLVIGSMYSADSRSVNTVMQNGEMWTWDVASGERTGTQTLAGGTVTAVDFSADGQQVLLAAAATVMLLDLDSGEVIHSFGANSASFYDIALSPDGRTMFSVSDLGFEVFYWDLTTGELVGHYTGIRGTGVTLSDDGMYAGLSPLAGSPFIEYVQILLPDEQVIAWAQANLEIPTLTCAQREQYGTPIRC